MRKQSFINCDFLKVLKQLAILEQRKFDDEDVTGDVEFLTEKLQSSVQDLSSFDEYATEVGMDSWHT